MCMYICVHTCTYIYIERKNVQRQKQGRDSIYTEKDNRKSKNKCLGDTCNTRGPLPAGTPLPPPEMKIVKSEIYNSFTYGVATISGFLEIIGLF